MNPPRKLAKRLVITDQDLKKAIEEALADSRPLIPAKVVLRRLRALSKRMNPSACACPSAGRG